MSDEPRKTYDGPLHLGPASTSPYPLSRLAPRHDLVDIAREIALADQVQGAAVGGQLGLIADQIRQLQDKARAILEKAQADAELHRVACSFSKTPGGTYHVYRRPGGARYFSILSPADWRGSPPHPHEGSYRLEADLSFTPVGPDAGIGVRDGGR